MCRLRFQISATSNCIPVRLLTGWTRGPAPADLRLALYALQSEVLRDLAREHDAVFVEPPGHLFDRVGFLRPEFANADPTHGNATYGREMVNEILAAQRVAA